MNPKQRAHRILKPLSAYEDLSRTPPPRWMDNLSIDSNEYVLGVYKNDYDPRRWLVVTTIGVLIPGDEGWSRVRYRDILHVHAATAAGSVQPDQKSQTDRLILELSDGLSATLPVEGGGERFRDAFEFARFIERARNDVVKGLNRDLTS